MNIATNILQVIEPDLDILRIDLDNKLEEDFKFGELYPMMWINDMFIAPGGVSSFEINMTGFLPRFSLSLSDDIDQFSSIAMPKKQDLLSVMIKDKKSDFKPIQANFTVDSISTYSGSVELTGVLFIPKFDKQVCISYDGMTTHEVLEQIALDLGLGFATNEDVTNDIQNWIIPFKKYSEFLSKINNYIYKGETLTYYEIFIDIYYNINMVNVSKLFESGLEDEETETYASLNDLSTWDSSMDGDEYEKKEPESISMPLFLTNRQDYIGNNNHFKRYDFDNNTGSTYKSLGINKTQRFYDLDEKMYLNHDLSLDFETDEELNELIVQDDEMDVYIWSGIINDNHHLNYEWVKFQSKILRSFYNRNSLRIELDRANFHLHRYIKIPVQVWTINAFDNDYLSDLEKLQEGDDDQENQNNEPQSNTTSEKDPILNKFISGYYTLKDYKIGWKNGSSQFHQECSFIKPLYVNVVNKIDNPDG